MISFGINILVLVFWVGLTHVSRLKAYLHRKRFQSVHLPNSTVMDSEGGERAFGALEADVNQEPGPLRDSGGEEGIDSKGEEGSDSEGGKAAPSDLEPLCEFCDSIDFRVPGFYETYSDEDELFNEYQTLHEVLENSTHCFFCRKVAEFFREWSRQNLDTYIPDLQNENNDASYVMKPVPDTYEDSYEDAPGGHLIRLQVQLNVVKPEGGAYGPKLQFQRCSQHPLRVEDCCNGGSLSDWESGQEQAYSGRIRPLVADTRLFRKWKETCCATHGDHCSSIFTHGRQPPRLRLVDVEKRCIVDSEVGTRYTALSYVWGKDKFSELTISTEAQFQQAGSLNTQTLPSTIDDAIEVTKSLGEKYIWVDSLCIKQNDDADKQEYLPKMDSIYGCAVVTIVAASGDNANAGLPGIRPNSRTREQVPFTIKGVSFLQTLDPEGLGDRFSYLGESAWYRRGWTFQEKIFSRRALIFTKEQVYWECQASSWCEDGLWETLKSPTVYRPCFAEKDFRHPWSSEVDNFERIYRKLVEEYTERMLTYAKDGLDAFAGILNAFERDAGQCFLWALPTSFISNALTWRPMGRCPNRRTEKCTVSVKKEEGSSDGTITHCAFPSWSWVGWAGSICTSTMHGRLNAKTVDLIFFYLDGSGSLRQVEATHATLSLSKMDVRRDDDRTIVTHDDIPESVLPYSIASNILFFWSSAAKLQVDSRGKKQPMLSHNGKDVPARIWFHTPGPEELGEFEFVVIGKFTEYGELSAYFRVGQDIERLLAVLLVSWEDGVAHRKGLVHIQSSDWVSLDNREWKLICLG